MVKPDVKVNYYAALELAPDASVDDCKKAYRKLALKWHPDRNRGNEEEAAIKFQAIAAANEILSDQAAKTKYDSDRRRATLGGAGPRPATSAQRPGSYNPPTPSAFPPPPRRTHDSTGWANRAANAARSGQPTGANRYADFPRPSPTARQPSESDKASNAEAWGFMNGAGATRPSHPGAGPSKQWANSWVPTGKPPQANSNQTRRPVPPPPVPPRDAQGQQPRRPPDLPQREDPRASRDHGPFGTNTAERTAYAHFNPQPSPQRPSVHRSNTTSAQVPRRPTGYDPNAANDERAAPSASAGYNTTQMKDPEAHSPPRAFTPTSPRFSPPQNFQDQRRASAQHGHASHTAFSSESANNARPDVRAQMKRSQSVRDTTRLDATPNGGHTRSDRQRSMSSDRVGSTRPKPATAASFNVRDDSDDSTSDSSDDDGPTIHTRQPPFGRRPVRKATGTRSRNGGQATPTDRAQPGMRSPRRGSYTGRSRQNSMSGQQGQPFMPSNPPMYDGTSSSPKVQHHHHSREPSDLPDTPARSASSTKWGRWPKWAIPTSVLSRGVGKQGIPQDDFHETPWEYVEESPLIDIDEKPRVNCHPSCTTHCIVNAHVSHERKQDLMELLSEKHDGFSTAYAFGAQDQAKSRSSEDINTTFSPTSQPPVFSGAPGANPQPQPGVRRTSPSKRGRETLSARQSRSNVNSRVSFDVDSSRPPASPGSALFGEIPPQPPAGTSPSPFSPDQWQGQHFFGQVPQPPSGPSPNPSHNGSFKVPSPPQPPMTTTASADSSGERTAGVRPQAADGDAMDIDPPIAEQGPDHSTARQYNVAPSQWRMSQGGVGQSANASRRRSSAQPSVESLPQSEGAPPPVPRAQKPGITTELPSLQPLSESLNGSGGQGLNNMSSLKDSVPFPSQASSIPPSQLTADDAKPGNATSSSTSATSLGLPMIPKAPDYPQQWSRKSFGAYTGAMHAYLVEMHKLHTDLAQHNAQFIMAESALLARGVDALQAGGLVEAHTDGGSRVETYARRVRQEEAWKEFERIVAEHHVAALNKYLEAKEQIMLRIVRGTLPDSLPGHGA